MASLWRINIKSENNCRMKGLPIVRKRPHGNLGDKLRRQWATSLEFDFERILLILSNNFKGFVVSRAFAHQLAFQSKFFAEKYSLSTVASDSTAKTNQTLLHPCSFLFGTLRPISSPLLSKTKSLALCCGDRKMTATNKIHLNFRH